MEEKSKNAEIAKLQKEIELHNKEQDFSKAQEVTKEQEKVIEQLNREKELKEQVIEQQQARAREEQLRNKMIIVFL
ncbi:MAG: hypothetical protein HC896_02640 [Bacteroidales bacterium]|nr:hypothetical protein [Bacteroidales bacterium]